MHSRAPNMCVQALTSILKKPGVRKKPFLVRSVDDVLTCARVMRTDAIAPVFLTSSVTGACGLLRGCVLAVSCIL